MYSDKKSASLVSPKPITSIHGTGLSHKLEMNVRSQVQKLEQSSITASNTNSSLRHLFNKKDLSPDQSHDLMNFRYIGQTEFERQVQYFVLCTPSVKTPKRLKRLLTFTERRSRRKILKKNGSSKLNVGRRELRMLPAPEHTWTLRTNSVLNFREQ